MRSTTLTSLLLIVLFECSCFQRPATALISDLGNGLRYERLLDVNEGTRVVTLLQSSSAQAGEIIVAGDVVWCERRGAIVVGQKMTNRRPADWSDAGWESLLRPVSQKQTLGQELDGKDGRPFLGVASDF